MYEILWRVAATCFVALYSVAALAGAFLQPRQLFKGGAAVLGARAVALGLACAGGWIVLEVWRSL
jgi:hypothetical protein